MNILFLIDELVVRGGTEQHLYELSTGLARCGHSVSVLSLADGPYGDAFRRNGEISYHTLGANCVYGWKGILAIMWISRYIRRNSVDILQTFHSGADLAGPVAGMLSFTRPVLFSSRRDLGYTKNGRHLAAQRVLNRFVYRIFANSRAVRDSVVMQEGCNREKIEIIYNGIHVERFSAPDPDVVRGLRGKFSISQGCCVVGSVGNIRPVKGYDVMVEAATRVCREDSSVIFIHAGDGAERAQLEARCRDCGIADRFKFLGAQSHIPEILSLMDIYLQPSRTEGFSNAILEAMSVGLPVVATRVGGNPEVVDEGVNGFLVDPEDVSSMVEKLLHLSREPETRKMLGSTGKEKVSTHFDFVSMIRNYERVYHGTVQSSGS